MLKRLARRLRDRRAERRQIAERQRRRLRAGELPSDHDTENRNVVGGALSQRPH